MKKNKKRIGHFFLKNVYFSCNHGKSFVKDILYRRVKQSKYHRENPKPEFDRRLKWESKKRYFHELAIKQGYSSVSKKDLIENTMCSLFFYEKPISSRVRLIVLLIHISILTSTFIGIFGIYLANKDFELNYKRADYDVAYNNRMSAYDRKDSINRLLEKQELTNLELSDYRLPFSYAITLLSNKFNEFRLMDGWNSVLSSFQINADNIVIKNSSFISSDVNINAVKYNISTILTNSELTITDTRDPSVTRTHDSEDSATFKFHDDTIDNQLNIASVYLNRSKLRIIDTINHVNLNNLCNDYVPSLDVAYYYPRGKFSTNRDYERMHLSTCDSPNSPHFNKSLIHERLTIMGSDSKIDIYGLSSYHIRVKGNSKVKIDNRIRSTEHIKQSYQLWDSSGSITARMNNSSLHTKNSNVTIASIPNKYDIFKNKNGNSNWYIAYEGKNEINFHGHSDEVHIELFEYSANRHDFETLDINFHKNSKMQIERMYIINNISDKVSRPDFSWICKELSENLSSIKRVTFVGNSSPCDFSDVISHSEHDKLKEKFSISMLPYHE
ncbi:hypothetical protein [Vibrio renipiscarius]|uniref:Uncharacterized protein n=1 Tax=Vibrio renipiscarius TaxID=1461322 RepID=A0A0C2K766_9VIBR|nr:hypothetical protein [Vibrio renipiscarius]KII76616.1 hypothetical protein OJ16_17690 [Vibrio renipiscarius]KII77863.1 hypothetical protein PL18_12880 [Vibrio renipiscarius]